MLLGSDRTALLGVALWGLGIGVDEWLMVAAIAEMVAATRRASAYGRFTSA